MSNERINDWMNELGGAELIKELNRITRVENKQRKQQRDYRSYLLHEERKFKTIEIDIYYKTPMFNGMNYDEFEIEGIENAEMILQQYRNIGHDMDIRKIVLSVDGKKFKTINFKY